MSFSFETKLHVLLIMTVVGIALYMYLLYKEVKIFQDEIVIMKQQIYTLQNFVPKVDDIVVKEKVHEQEQEQEHEHEQEDSFVEDVDNISVTSNEIKDILTNIQKDEPDEKEHEHEHDHANTDLSFLTETELNTISYSVLRDYLKNKKLSYKGTKAEFIQRILLIAS